MLNLTKTASSNGSNFIVWPEEYINPIPTTESCQEYISKNIIPYLQDVNAFVVVGCRQNMKTDECPVANLAFTVAPKGSAILGFYGKQHPVTMIGEKSCLLDGYVSYPMSGTNNLRFSTLICYDMDFPDSAAIVADLGASLILNPSEDWAAARGHFAASVFRAVENRIAVAKTDWGWDSAIIDPLGRSIASYNTIQMQREILTAVVPVFENRTSTNYIRQHVLPHGFCILTAGLIGIKLFQRIMKPQFRDEREARLIPSP
jgi:apolipoprotein N-acyltransferase